MKKISKARYCLIVPKLTLLGLLGLQPAYAVCTSAINDMHTYYTSGQTMLYDTTPPLWTPLVPLPFTESDSYAYHGFRCSQPWEAPAGATVRIDTIMQLPTLRMLPSANSGDGKSYMVYQIPGQQYFGIIVSQTNSDGYYTPLTLNTGAVHTGNINRLQFDLSSSNAGVVKPTYGTIVTLDKNIPPGSYNIPRTAFDLGKVYINGFYYSGADSFGYIPAMTVIIRSKTCSISAPSVVILPNTSTDTFRGTDSISSTIKSVPVTVNCAATPGLASTKVSAVFTDAQDASNRSNLLTQRDTDTSNVQIGLYLNSTQTPLNFGPDSDKANTTNSFSVGTVGWEGGTLSIPLVAAYVATSGNSTPGKVSGMATMTLLYQ